MKLATISVAPASKKVSKGRRGRHPHHRHVPERGGEGAESDAAARRIALSIGNSPLVKTMLAAADANWGRLVMAVGKAGEAAERDRLRLWIGDEQCAEGGRVCEGYSEERATEHLKGDEVRLRADVGTGRSTIWTCDLTHAYIDINAGYRS